MQTTSKGDQRKWYHEGEWLKANKFGYEGLAEWVVYELLKRSNVDRSFLVPYHLCNIHTPEGEVLEGCLSKNFLNPGEEFITLQRFLESSGLDLDDFPGYTAEGKITNLLGYLAYELGLRGLKEYFQHMLVLDAVVLNEDRHTNNIAFIRSEEGYFRLCPFFDHGLSLLSDTIQYNDKYGITMNIDSVKAKPFDEDFLRQARTLTVENPLRFDKSSVLEFMEENKKVLGRVYDILKVQMQRYSYVFDEKFKASN